MTRFGGVLLILAIAAAHECNHDHFAATVKRKKDVQPKAHAHHHDEHDGHHGDNHHGHVQKQTLQPFRIVVEYDTTKPHCTATNQTIARIEDCGGTDSGYVCDASDVLTAEKETAAKTMIAEAVTFWSEVLTFQPRPFLHVSAGPCCALTIPESNTTDRDYTLHVSFHPTCSAGTAGTACQLEAWAVACTSDSVTDRPIVGQANFAPHFINANPTELERESELLTTIHEMAHALGFSNGWFNHFKQSNGSDYPADPVQGFTDARGLSRQRLATPAVTRAVREHFSCQTMAGAELENQGGSGTASTHWEKRLFDTELMTGGQADGEGYFSRMTLALFEDSGWYTVNYAHPRVHNLRFGLGMGCALTDPSNACSTWSQQAQDEGLFCSVQGASGKCSPDHAGEGYCDLLNYNQDLPENYQYFAGQPTWGGSTMLSDFCPKYRTYSNRYCRDDTQTATQDSASLAQYYGHGSLCFKSTAVRQGSSSSKDLRCHRSCCLGSSILRVFLDVNQVDYVTCTTGGTINLATSGQVVSSSGQAYAGEVTCPSPSDWCPTTDGVANVALPCPSSPPSATPSTSPSRPATASASSTQSATPSATSSQSKSASVSLTSSLSFGASPSATWSPSVSSSATTSSSASSSQSLSSSASPSADSTVSPSATRMAPRDDGDQDDKILGVFTVPVLVAIGVGLILVAMVFYLCKPRRQSSNSFRRAQARQNSVREKRATTRKQELDKANAAWTSSTPGPDAGRRRGV